MADNISNTNTNTINSNENNSNDRALIRRMGQIFRRQSGIIDNNTTTSGRMSNANIATIMANSNSSSIGIVPTPQTAPTRCYDPIMAQESNINNESTTFYIAQQNGIIQTAACLDEESLNEYKSREELVFFRCHEALSPHALHVGVNNIVPGPMRLLNFAVRVYVKDIQAQQLQPGRRYLLTPISDLGRIVSLNMLRSGIAIGASHCSPAYGSKLYKIEEIRQPTGGNKKQQRKSYRKKRKSIRRLRAKNYTRKQKGYSSRS